MLINLELKFLLQKNFRKERFIKMSTLSLPESLHNQIKKLASEDGISINQFVVSAVAEKKFNLRSKWALYNHT